MIAVLLTGGTIASTPLGSEGRFAPHAADPVKAVIKARSEAVGLDVGIEVWRDLKGDEMSLIDSCDIRPDHWHALSAQIDELAARYEGVVVLHGTDSLAYSAAALSLLRPRRSAAVVLTGAQVAVGLADSDAGDNIALAIRAAMGEWGDIAGDTLIAFGQRLIRGVRATKVSTTAKNGFDSRVIPAINLLEPAQNRAAIWHTWQAARDDRGPKITGFGNDITHVLVQPGIDWGCTRERLLALPPKGVLLSLYGTGSAPQAVALASLADELAEQGCLSVAVSACVQGAIAWRHYAATQPIEESALINAGDMTIECACVKLMAAVHDALPTSAARAFFQQSVSGECSFSTPSTVSC